MQGGGGGQSTYLNISGKLIRHFCQLTVNLTDIVHELNCEQTTRWRNPYPAKLCRDLYHPNNDKLVRDFSSRRMGQAALDAVRRKSQAANHET